MKLHFKLIFGFLMLASLALGSDRSIVRFGRDVEIKRHETVKSAVSFGGDVRVEGRVKDAVVSFGGDIYLGSDAVVKGDVVTLGGEIFPEPGAEVEGDFVELGSGNFGPHHWFGYHPLRPFSFFIVLSLIGLMGIGILVVAVMPGTMQKLTNRLEDDILKALLYGLVQLLLIVPVIIFLAVTIIGIALIPALILAIVLASFLGYFVSATLLGKRVVLALRHTESTMVVEFIVGILLLWFVQFVPFFGGLVKFLAFLTGFGVVGIWFVEYRRTKSASRTQPEPAKITETPEENPPA